MTAEEILWGGNNKCVIRLKKNIELEPGTLTDLQYDYVKGVYCICDGIDNAEVILDSSAKELLDNIYLSGSVPSTLVRVVDKGDEDGIVYYVIEIKVFQNIVVLGQLNSLKIKISDDVIDRMRIKDKSKPIEYLNGAFKYNDMVFAKGYGRKGASFTLLSKDRALNIRQENNEFIATNLVRYDSQKADFDAVYILKGEIEFVDDSTIAQLSAEVTKKINVITSGGAYFDIWEAYNDLDRIFAFKQATENGVIPYKACSCKLTDCFEYCFDISVSDVEYFPDAALIDCTDSDDILKIEEFTEVSQLKDIHTVSVGTFDRVEDGKLYIIDRESDIQKNIPTRGYLFVSIIGDAVRLSRREKAKAEIETNQAPIHDLSLIIDKGVSNAKQVRRENPVTSMLMKKYPNKIFNEDQRNAIEVAINTPDIALIMGPPGTGKTTVIKAIISRYEEYYRKYNDKKIPKILVTSFQHEAVENVIVDLDGNGLPSERKGGKINGEDKKSISISKWRDKTNQYISDEILSLTSELADTTSLRDKIYAWKEKGKDPAEGLELLQEAISGNRLSFSKELNDEINELFVRTQVDFATDNKDLERIIDENNEDVTKVLLSQRTTIESYVDDGKKHAFRLKQMIIQGMIDNNGDISFIDDVLATKGADEAVMKKYAETVGLLLKKYVKEEKKSTLICTEDAIEKCLKAIDGELNKLKLEKLENRDEATAYALKNYIEALQDEKEIERIVERYSNVTAATCQQSMEVGKFANNSVYDLVIVDEAARANPLDLLIPMSMGRQLILVGDHKQLPHMLDTEVVKQFEKDEKMQELGVLKKSMFERLFDMFDIKEQTVKRTAKLTKQYRMNPVIGDFASKVFYDGFLDSSEVLVEEKQANLDMYNNSPVAWIDLDKNKYGLEDKGRSKSRNCEAKRIVSEIKKVFSKNPKKTVGVITFYRKQSELIKRVAELELSETQRQRLEIGTVDAFQGKEFDVVFLSCVRANTYGVDEMRRRVGHVNDNSRLCVSFTRAKQQMVVVGDSDTVECVKPLAEYISLCKDGGAFYG